MNRNFWIRRFLQVFALAFVVIGMAQFLKGHALDYCLTQAAIWGLLSSAIFTGFRYNSSRKGQHCALCKDTPETQETRQPEGHNKPSV